MRIPRAFASAFVVAGFLAASPVASAQTQDTDAAVRTGDRDNRGTMGGAGGAHAFTGAHQLSGTVTEVDETAGALSLRSDSGDTLQLRFPPPAVADLAAGDRVTVQLALRTDTGADTGRANRTEGAARTTTKGGATGDR